MMSLFNIQQWEQIQTSLPSLSDSYDIKHKPTSVKNPQANTLLERIHAVIMNMLRTAKIEMADSVKPSVRCSMGRLLNLRYGT